MLHWSIFLAGVAFTAIASTQGALIEKWENPDLVQGIDEQDHKNVKFADGYFSEFGAGFGLKNTTCHCGAVNDDIRDAGRIINGNKVQQESKYPFVVMLGNETFPHLCGGSILTDRHILTAAHCISDVLMREVPNVHPLRVTVGVHSKHQVASHGETQTFRVESAHIPADWYNAPLYTVRGNFIRDMVGDIAILVLETQIRFSQWVGPVCLTNVMPSIDNKYITAMGWGRTEEGSPETLIEADVLVEDTSRCLNDPRKFCFKNDGIASCNGDSGGPYVHLDPETNRYTQVSLVSHGLGGPCEKVKFVGTNVVHYYKWIKYMVAATTGGYGICEKIR